VQPSAIEDLLRELAPRVLADVARSSRDFDAAEDAVQEALLAAAQHWPVEGVPVDPRGWLRRTAGLRLVDHARSERSRRDRELATAVTDVAPAPASDADDSLIVLFLCCHPALTPPSAVALTLRAVGGLTTREIANAFLVPEATMAQRISRAKQSIKAAGAAFRMPDPTERPAALRSVLRALYLIFNEGYATTEGETLHRVELSDEAIRLTRMLRGSLPDEPEVAGLLALMLLVDARRPARTDGRGDVVPLDRQDRSLWDTAPIAEGTQLLSTALAMGRVGEYQLQAAIAALHDEATAADATDWSQIAALYGLLEQVTGSPIVTLNRAVAAGMAGTPEDGLAMLATVADRLAGNYRVDAVRGHLLEMSGEPEGAADCFARAAYGTANLPERRHLIARAARLRSVSSPNPGPGRDSTGQSSDVVADPHDRGGLASEGSHRSEEDDELQQHPGRLGESAGAG
jgi:RNA polymerase sigma factor (sigma-70 family)